MSIRTLDANAAVNDFVKEDIRRSALFERLGIDCCCGGRKTLAEACAEKGLDPRKVMDQIYSPVPDGRGEEKDKIKLDDLSPGELAGHVEKTHHVYEKKAMPRLASLIDKIVAAHGKNHSELAKLKGVFAALQAEMEQHMMKEEKILFPMIRQLDETGPQEFHCGSIANPIRVMRMEHDHADGYLAEMRRLTGNYAVPEDGCGTYRSAMEELKTFEADLLLHMQTENDLLFPKALEEAGRA